MIRIRPIVKHFISIAAITGALAASLIGMPITAQAAGSTFQVVGGPGINICSAMYFSFPINATNSAPASDVSTLSVPGFGIVFTFAENSSPGSFSSFAVNPSAYTVAPHTAITFVDTGYNGPNQTGGVAYSATAVFDCTTGDLLSTGSGSAGNLVPQVPPGFVMKQVTCTTLVLIGPGQQAVGSAQVVAGQRWYVNPTPVKGTNGISYTELFDGGMSDGYIPTSCINMGFNYVYGLN